MEKVLIKGEIADYHLDESGIMYSYSKNIKRTVANISRNIQLVQEITSNKPVPLLIHLCKSPVPDKETRKYSRENLHIIYSAMAMVAEPGLSFIIMKMVFAFQKPSIPIQAFTDEESAKKWLLQFV